MEQSSQQRLRELLSRLLDGEPAEADAAQLAEILRDDPQARAAYHAHIALHAMFHWQTAPPLSALAGGAGDAKDGLPSSAKAADSVPLPSANEAEHASLHPSSPIPPSLPFARARFPA